jgi:hypothetical protein
MAGLDFGSLNEPLSRTSEGRNLLRSAGPISDAYILSTEPVSLITGPGGSGKTTASIKKCLVEAQRIFPGSDGVRRYVVGVWRQKYDNLWKATINSWWKILPEKLPGSEWTGSSPRAAQHIVRFRDAWSVSHGSEIELIAQFRAFGDAADPDDLLGNECTDVWLNEMSTMPEALFIGLADRIGRDPPREVIRRAGRFFGDSNAPDVMNYCYRDFYETLKDGYKLFRQPGGLHPQAENIEAVGREYYLNSIKINKHRPWWIKRMVHALPGFTRDNDAVYDKFDDDLNMSKEPLEVYRQLPVIVGIDGGYTPSAIYMQEMGDGQLRILAELVLERGRMKELGRAMLALEAAQFPGCDFTDWCDPSMTAGEDVEEGSDRQKLGEALGRTVNIAQTNETGKRVSAIADKIELNLGPGRPGLLVDPRCKALRRGFNQTYHYRRTHGTNDLSSIVKTPDSHPHDAAQYGALQCGSQEARRRTSDIQASLRRRREESREAGRYNPLQRRRA